jgi:hypothetical protein
MLTFTDDNTQVWIAHDHIDAEGRCVYRYSFLRCGIELSAPQTDLRSGVGGGTLLDGLRSLASFLGAWCEARDEDSENWALFPVQWRDLAVDWDAFTQNLSAEIEEEGR